MRDGLQLEISVRQPPAARVHGGAKCRPCAIAIGLALLVVGGCAERQRPRNVLLIIVDTLRQDRLSLYGGDRPTSPSLDRFSRHAVVFDQAVSNSVWTLPAISALLAGRYLTAEVSNRGLQQSLVERLRDTGWDTAAFTEGGFFSTNYGLERGFRLFNQLGVVWVPPPRGVEPERPEIEAGEEIAQTFSLARTWLSEHDRRRPFFLVVHTYETHLPYLRSTFVEDVGGHPYAAEFDVLGVALMERGRIEPTPDLIEHIRALYDGGVAEADRYVGDLIESLDEFGLAEDTLVVVTSDHGEDLGDRDPPRPGTHGNTLFDEQALVPLLIRDPTRDYPLRRVAAQVRTIDIMPTIFELLGIERDAAPRSPHSGRSLVPLMTGDETEHRTAFVRVQRGKDPDLREMYALRAGRWKLIVVPGETLSARSPAPERVWLFDLDHDSGEHENLTEQEADTASSLYGQLEAIRSELDARGRPDFTSKSGAGESQHERLRALGYIE